MDSREYDEWAKRHGMIFGFGRKDDDMAMLLSWFDLFAAQGFTVADLFDSTLALGLDPPQFRDQHLTQIPKAIRRARAAKAEADRRTADRARLDTADQYGADCGTCRSEGGTLNVPDLRSVKEGQWEHPWYEAAVACPDCEQGRMVFAAFDKWALNMGHRPPLNYGEYYRRNPTWRKQLAERAEIVREANRQSAVARSADKQRGPLTGGIGEMPVDLNLGKGNGRV